MEQIFSADRQSLLAEIRDMRAHTNVSVLRHQEEKERLTEQLNSVEDQTSKQEHQLKRQGNLVSSQRHLKRQGNLVSSQCQLKRQDNLVNSQYQLKRHGNLVSSLCQLKRRGNLGNSQS